MRRGTRGGSDPRRRHRARARRGDAPRARGDRRRVRLGRPGGRRRRNGEARRQPAARRRPRRDPADGGRPQGADHDAGRRRLPLGERRAPQEPRSLRAGPSVQDLSRSPHALLRRGPRRHPREHRGPLRGHRVRTGRGRDGRADRLDRVARRLAPPPRRGHLDQAALDHGAAPDRAGRFGWCEPRGARLRPREAGIWIRPLSIRGTRRIVHFAFDYARRMNRRKVTAVHKANIMKFTDGLYLRVAREVAAENDDIEFDDRIVDNMCMQLVQRPEEYDVLVLPNLYGDVLSDLCAGMIGGLGLAPGANYGEDAAVFEPTHGSAPKYAGQNKVNPMAQLLSGMLMLRHLDEQDAAENLEQAIAEVIREGKSVTYDMKPRRDDPTAVGTSEVADALIEKLGARVA